MNSLRMWKDVSDAVIRDDMFAADNAKKKVEHEQRIRERKREQEGTFFKISLSSIRICFTYASLINTFFFLTFLGAEYKAVYFDQVLVNQKLQWVPKEGIEISKTSLEGLKEVVAKQKVLGTFLLSCLFTSVFSQFLLIFVLTNSSRACSCQSST